MVDPIFLFGGNKYNNHFLFYGNKREFTKPETSCFGHLNNEPIPLHSSLLKVRLLYTNTEKHPDNSPDTHGLFDPIRI